MTVTNNPAHDTAVTTREGLMGAGWVETRVSHFRHPDIPSFAVEVGYVYGEVTVRFKTVKKGIDRGEFHIMRGVGEPFMAEVRAMIGHYRWEVDQ